MLDSLGIPRLSALDSVNFIIFHTTGSKKYILDGHPFFRENTAVFFDGINPPVQWRDEEYNGLPQGKDLEWLLKPKERAF